MAARLNKVCSIFWGVVYLLTGVLCSYGGINLCVDETQYNVAVLQYPHLGQNQQPWLGSIGAMAAIGIYCLLAGVLGMVATILDNRKLLIIFVGIGAFGAASVLVYASVTAAGFAKENALVALSTMRTNREELYRHENGTDRFTRSWNRFQIYFRCCGMDNYTDYSNGVFFNSTGVNLIIPWSCCTVEPKNWKAVDISTVIDLGQCRAEAADPNANFTHLNTQGCGYWLYYRHRTYWDSLMSYTWLSAGLQTISVIVIGVLRKQFKIGIAETDKQWATRVQPLQHN